MKCPVYRATISASLCLIYQDRAAGILKPRNNVTFFADWKMKYQPCLTCETGKQIKKNGGNDMDADVQALKERYQTYQCRKCGEVRDKDDFYKNSEGKILLAECKACASERHKAAALAKKVTVNETPAGIVEGTSRTCRQCGHTGPDSEFHLTGLHGVTNVCKECAKIKREISMNKKPSHTIESYPVGAVVLDFAEYPEILETITLDARENFRSINNEILFRLVNFEAK